MHRVSAQGEYTGIAVRRRRELVPLGCARHQGKGNRETEAMPARARPGMLRKSLQCAHGPYSKESWATALTGQCQREAEASLPKKGSGMARRSLDRALGVRSLQQRELCQRAERPKIPRQVVAVQIPTRTQSRDKNETHGQGLFTEHKRIIQYASNRIIQYASNRIIQCAS